MVGDGVGVTVGVGVPVVKRTDELYLFPREERTLTMIVSEGTLKLKVFVDAVYSVATSASVVASYIDAIDKPAVLVTFPVILKPLGFVAV